MAKFNKVAQKSDIENGKMKEYKIDGKTLVIANVDGEYLAFDGICTHAYCALAGGFLDSYTLTCYCHGGQFDIKSGEVLSLPPPAPINVYPVKIEDDDILIKL
ncbi:hypothetical protein A2W14_00765 [Candidatus Gottesmanbacteria bacterium RBG_16_37_8]|uniref:Rieske domain-containing protein n=1 Tax=Candidatus Gottesmanbacteria bacterium RBG_16_37_8 TaxID=1798371 RepID=A0A1F5YVT7_9BACT|nr:MAG: hypothetical protein A2W14_00765 [Candidatus Gottesmanbacteria bacterium RBG_16_37_8]